jgi:RNA polymerase sigma factor (TIGR02999 family)
MGETSRPITQLLNQLSTGDQTAADRLIPLVLTELQQIAGHYMRTERRGHTLQPTALVNEAFLRLVGGAGVDWKSRAHFFAVAAHVMRRILIDHARLKRTEKRGGGDLRNVTIEENVVFSYHDPVELLSIDEALNRLAEFDARQCRIVELRFFAGLSVEETAEILQISGRTVKREWNLARAWLHGELSRAAQ